MPVLNLPSAQIDDAVVATLPSVALAIEAGLRDADLASVVERDLVGRDLLYTITIMCAPEGQSAAVRLHEALVAGELYEVLRFLESAGIPCMVDGDVTLAIAEREDSQALIKAMFEHDWLGHIAAGYVLRWIISRYRAGIHSDVSLAAAVKAIETWCHKHGIKGGGAEHVTRNVWPKYKAVSHLWAAYWVCRDAEINIFTAAGFQEFVSTAQWLLETAAVLVPRGRRPGDTVLDRAGAWAIPSNYVLRTVLRQPGSADVHLGIRATWSDDPDAHDIRLTGKPPFLL